MATLTRADVIDEAALAGAPRPTRIWGALLVLLTESENQHATPLTRAAAIRRAREVLNMKRSTI